MKLVPGGGDQTEIIQSSAVTQPVTKIRIEPGIGSTAQDLRDIVDGWEDNSNGGRDMTVTTSAGNVGFSPLFQFTTPVTKMEWTPTNFLNPVPVGAVIESIDVPCH